MKLIYKLVRRADLFFGRYTYCFRTRLNECFSLRNLDHAKIDRIVQHRKAWGRNMQRANQQPGSWAWARLEISDRDVENLHLMCDWLLTDTRERKIVVATNWCYIYTDDRSLLDDLALLPWLDQSYMSVTQTVLHGRPNCVVHKRPKHQMRSYLRGIKFDDSKRQNLAHLLSRQENIRLSPSLEQWVFSPKWIRTQDYYFIDHDDNGIITLLSLIEPRIIRRTLPIVADK